jgi:uncharacterized protein YceH (UPF0502 family)
VTTPADRPTAGLSDVEVRVLGCLIEKRATTPDQYPLTLNALLAACNQRTNRDPVVAYVDAQVIEAIGSLRDRGLCRLTHSPGQRAVKYAHTAEAVLDADHPALALLAVLMLRGPQTPGELRSRTARYHHFGGPAEMEAALDGLARQDPPLVTRLERRPGEKESRWRQLLGEQAGLDAPRATPDGVPPAALEARVAALEAEVARLRAIVETRAVSHDLGDVEGELGSSTHPEAS